MKKIFLVLSVFFLISWIYINNNREPVQVNNKSSSNNSIYVYRTTREVKKDSIVNIDTLSKEKLELKNSKSNSNDFQRISQNIVGFKSKTDISPGDIISYNNSIALKEEQYINEILSSKGQTEEIKKYLLKFSKSFVKFSPYSKVDVLALVSDSVNLSINEDTGGRFGDFKMITLISNAYVSTVETIPGKSDDVVGLYITTSDYKKLIMAQKFMKLILVPHDGENDNVIMKSSDIYKVKDEINQYRGR